MCSVYVCFTIQCLLSNVQLPLGICMGIPQGISGYTHTHTHTHHIPIPTRWIWAMWVWV
jgi:hypothetical protein